MSTSPPVYDPITDAVTQANLSVLTESPALAMAHLYQTVSNSITKAMIEAAKEQYIAWQFAQAMEETGVAIIYSVDTTASTLFPKVTPDMVIGGILYSLTAPHGKRSLEATVAQVNDAIDNEPDAKVMAELKHSITAGIATALEAGVSKQHVCYSIHEACAGHDVSLLYPLLPGDELISGEDIEGYYLEMIARHRKLEAAGR